MEFPSRLLDTAFTDLRMIAAAALILPAFCTLTLPGLRWRRAVFGVVSAITLANLAVISVVWLSYRADYAAMIELFGKLDRGARVLVGTTGPGYDPPFHDLTEYPMYYAPTLQPFMPTPLWRACSRSQASSPCRRGPTCSNSRSPTAASSRSRS